MANPQCFALPQGAPCSPVPSCVICLGNFDGVHLAHRELLRSARAFRNQNFPHASLAVFCFPTPSSDFFSSAPAAHLCSLEQKLSFFADEGVEFVFLAEFEDVRELSSEEFAKTVLLEQCHAVAAVCGFNYRFGKGGLGRAEDLESLLNSPVLILDRVDLGGEAVSSTRIRSLLSKGDAKEAARLLCRPYSITAPVLHGKALGRNLGIPTINQNFPKGALIPRHGVYLTSCHIEDREFIGVSNVGVHPTVDLDASVNCETFLLDFDGDLYGKTVTVSFLDYLREEAKFSSKEALTEQVHRDVAAARTLAKALKITP